MCHLPPKMTPNVSKKQICEIWHQKSESGNPAKVNCIGNPAKVDQKRQRMHHHIVRVFAFYVQCLSVAGNITAKL